MTEPLVHTLEWGTPHRLALADDMTPRLQSPRIVGVLKLNKPGGKQDIPISFPEGVTLDMVKAAWEAQGSKWVELFVCERPNFIAVRVIWLPEGQALMWLVIHILNKPHDLCAIAPLTPDDWSEKIVAIASAAGAA